MIKEVTITGAKKKPVKLIFGIYALRNFTKRIGCGTEISSLLAAFQGSTRVMSMAELIRVGYEQATAEIGVPATLTDFEACKILESATEEQADEVFKAFITSVLNEDYDEWFTRLEAQYKDATEEDSDESEKENDSEKKS